MGALDCPPRGSSQTRGGATRHAPSPYWRGISPPQYAKWTAHPPRARFEMNPHDPRSGAAARVVGGPSHQQRPAGQTQTLTISPVRATSPPTASTSNAAWSRSRPCVATPGLKKRSSSQPPPSPEMPRYYSVALAKQRFRVDPTPPEALRGGRQQGSCATQVNSTGLPRHPNRGLSRSVVINLVTAFDKPAYHVRLCAVPT